MTALAITQLERVFLYGTARLADPDSSMSPQEVKEFYSMMYPELTTAEIEGFTENGEVIEYTFKKAVGTKG
jgi:PRTRC genetic system protein C